MGRVVVIGTGPTGLAAAEVLVQSGIEVDLLDASHPERDRAPTAPVTESAGGFFGEVPARLLRKQIFGSDFVFADVERTIPLEGPWLPRSAARGGLSNVWGAGCYPLRDEDYADWPIEPNELRIWFARAARFLHVSGTDDGLSEVYGRNDVLPETLNGSVPDPGSPFEVLLESWAAARAPLAARGLRIGRSRLAVRRGASKEPGYCTSCGQCLVGCPEGAIWNGEASLRSLIARGVRYRPGHLVRDWRDRDSGLWLSCGDRDASAREVGPYQAAFLAAGPVSSFRIAAQSLPDLPSPRTLLSENDVLILPFLFQRGLHHGSRRFTLSEAVVALDPSGALERPAHLQLYRPGEATLGAFANLIERMPSGIRHLAEAMIGRIALGMLYLHGAESRKIELRLGDDAGPIRSVQAISRGKAGQQAAAAAAVKRLVEARRLLGLRPLPLLKRVGGPGFSAHLGASLPIKHNPGALQCHIDGRLAASARQAPVYVVDLSSMPEIPAQNPTLTGVANAMRIAAGYAGARA